MAEKVICGGGLVTSGGSFTLSTSGSIIITGVAGMGWTGGGSLARGWDGAVTNSCSKKGDGYFWNSNYNEHLLCYFMTTFAFIMHFGRYLDN